MKDKNSNAKILILVLACALCGASNYLSVKIALREIPPFSFIFLRYLISFILILPFFLREKFNFHSKDTGKIILFSLLPALNVVLFVLGLLLTTSTLASMIHMIIPVLIVGLSHVILKEKITTRRLLGIFIGLTGATLIIFFPSLGKSQTLTGNLIGNTLIFFSSLFFAAYGVLSKKLQKVYSPVYLNVFFIVMTMMLGAILALFDFTKQPFWYKDLSLQPVIALVISAVFGTVLAYTLYQYATKYGSPLIASMTIYLQPVIVFIFASLLFGEKLTLTMFLGALLVFIGAYLVTKKSQITKLPID